MHRRLLAVLVLLALCAGCARSPTKPPLPEREAARARPQAGELYAPHIPDGGPALPPDLRGIAEPIPVPEPRARYGNRSPYTVLGRSYHVMDSARGYRERGIASWYGNKFHGRPTSSFEPYDMYKFTAAHKTLPLPSFVRVTNLENGRSVVVRVNDRGPFHAGRIIDLSYAAAVKLGIHLRGTAEVEVEAIDTDSPRLASAPAPAPARAPTTTPAPGGERSYRSAFGAPAAGGKLYLQVASFSERDNARRLKSKLDAADVGRVRVEKAEVGRRDVWRVRIGPLRSEAEIDPVRRSLFRLGLGEPQAIRER